MKSEIKGPRIGPLQKMPRGKHKGKDILWVIKEDPYEFMVAVKEYLQISEEQARVFKRVTKGGIIPKEYIFKIGKKVVREIFEEEKHEKDPCVSFTEGMNYQKWLQGKDIEEDTSFL